MAALEIVWRNPNPVVNQRRWEAVKRDPCRTLYVVQELESNEYRWDTYGEEVFHPLADLEVICGGRAA